MGRGCLAGMALVPHCSYFLLHQPGSVCAWRFRRDYSATTARIATGPVQNLPVRMRGFIFPMGMVGRPVANLYGRAANTSKSGGRRQIHHQPANDQPRGSVSSRRYAEFNLPRISVSKPHELRANADPHGGESSNAAGSPWPAGSKLRAMYRDSDAPSFLNTKRLGEVTICHSPHGSITENVIESDPNYASVPRAVQGRMFREQDLLQVDHTGCLSGAVLGSRLATRRFTAQRGSEMEFD